MNNLIADLRSIEEASEEILRKGRAEAKRILDETPVRVHAIERALEEKYNKQVAAWTAELDRKTGEELAALTAEYEKELGRINGIGDAAIAEVARSVVERVKTGV